MQLDADDSQLVLVDYQVHLMPVIFENEMVVANALRLAHIARLNGRTRLGYRAKTDRHFNHINPSIAPWKRPQST